MAITAETLIDNLVSVEFTVRLLSFSAILYLASTRTTNTQVQNPLDADLVIEFVQADAGLDGQVFARFSQGFPSFVVPAGQSVNSGMFGNVLLTQGAIASLGIIPAGKLDVSAAVTVRVGQGGYEVPFLKLSQTGVPTKYDVAL